MFFAFSNYLFEFIFDNQISESLKLPILILCVAFYLNNIQNIIYRISLAVNETKIVLKKDIISAIIVIPLSFILIKEYGVVGGSISVLLYFLIGNLYFLPIISIRYLNLKLSEIYSLHLKILIKFSLIFLPMFFITNKLDLNFLIELSISIITIVVYFIFSFFVLDTKRKKYLIILYYKFFNKKK